MMRNEYFSDGYFEGYDWALEQVDVVESINVLAVRAEQKMASVPFTNDEDARQWRDGFTSGVKSMFRNRPAKARESEGGDSTASDGADRLDVAA